MLVPALDGHRNGDASAVGRICREQTSEGQTLHARAEHVLSTIAVGDEIEGVVTAPEVVGQVLDATGIRPLHREEIALIRWGVGIHAEARAQLGRHPQQGLPPVVHDGIEFLVFLIGHRRRIEGDGHGGQNHGGDGQGQQDLDQGKPRSERVSFHGNFHLSGSISH